MDALHPLLEALRHQGLVAGHLRGLFHILIGRRITAADGTVISTGITWRELATFLKNERLEKELVEELNVDPEQLSPRDRERFWYSAIALAQPDSFESMKQADHLIAELKTLGFVVGPAPAPPRVAPRPLTPQPPMKPEGRFPSSKKKKK
jgi:hypothetical protein